MLSFFPELLFLSPFAALLIRIALAVLFATDGWRLISQNDPRSRIGGIAALFVAAALFVGIWTQLFALGMAIILIISLFIPRFRIGYPMSTIALALVMTLTLLITGPGPFAFDLPL